MIDDKITYDNILSTWKHLCESGGSLISRGVDFLYVESERFDRYNPLVFTWFRISDIQNGKFTKWSNIKRGAENTCYLLWRYWGERADIELTSITLILACLQDISAPDALSKSGDWLGGPHRMAMNIEMALRNERREELLNIRWHHNSNALPVPFDTFLYKPPELESEFLDMIHNHVVFNLACWKPAVLKYKT